jgi:putative transposase
MRPVDFRPNLRPPSGFGRLALRVSNWTRFSYINQNVSLARRRVIHVQRVAALRDLISAV